MGIDVAAVGLVAEVVEGSAATIQSGVGGGAVTAREMRAASSRHAGSDVGPPRHRRGRNHTALAPCAARPRRTTVDAPHCVRGKGRFGPARRD